MSIPFKLEKALLKESPVSDGGLADDLASISSAAYGDIAGVSGMTTPPWADRNLHFRFNPDKLTLAKTSNFKEQPRPSSQQANQKTPPPPQYVGSHNRTLSFSVLLDEWDAPPGMGRDVGDMVGALQKLMDPPSDKPQSEVPLPPRMSFHWGSFVFSGYITKADAVFTLFRQDGSPARAEVQIVMTEHIDTPRRQNPTSGGPAGRRSRIVIEGDNLQLLSYREYGKSSYWRAVAEVNGIDDPLAVRPGTRLMMPSREDARGLR